MGKLVEHDLSVVDFFTFVDRPGVVGDVAAAVDVTE